MYINAAKKSLALSRKIPKAMKAKIEPYVNAESQYRNGIMFRLTTASEIKKTSKKASAVSMGADKNGFFVYTHRARSKSKASPSKITKKEIDWIESTA